MAATTSAKRRKLDRGANAAYAASQPLFDALRQGVAKTSEHKIHLQKARDTVQGLHVKLVDTTNIDDTEKHELYMECAVKAWRSASEAFTDIFEELCKITAADPAEGRKAGEHYDDFEKLAWTARAGRRACREYQRLTGKATASPKPAVTPKQSQREKKAAIGSAGHRTARETPEAERLTPQPSRPSLPVQTTRETPERERLTPQPSRPSAAIQTAKRLRPAPSPESLDAGEERPAKKLDTKSAGPAEQPDATNGKNKRKRLAKREKRKSGASVAENASVNEGASRFEQGTSTPNTAAGAAPVSAGKENAIPGVEYEDVSAEVAARLKAKAEKRKAKREEKKRKRESGDSVLADAAADAVIAERPSKKKKSQADGTGGVAEAGADKIAKRKQDAGEAEGMDAGAKKRKKVMV